ncbi:MAG: hypothetical protein COA36_02465 [Desulfotalea sp.]|nr:MAG: hypothetical protein COA36_02465 [Desulfotalea sp.]
MKISDSTVQLFSERNSIEMHQKRESLTVWQDNEEPRVSHANRGRGQGRGSEVNSSFESIHSRRDKVSLGYHGHMKNRQVSKAEMDIPEDVRVHIDLNMRVLLAMFERLTGRVFQMAAPLAARTIELDDDYEDDYEGDNELVQSAEPSEAAAGNAGFGLEYNYHESHYEYEKTEFKSQGVIKTGDGREISFNVSLSMSREFYSEQNINVKVGDALKDPLVVNFSGAAAEVSQRDFHFDIDADGHADQIGFVSPGSGFLALDKNNDGRINDGSELFGALSGDGFADLAAYDSDNNNWIDENDDIFESLRIWSRNELGEEQLMGLGQAGVGALYLGHIETLFSVKDSENALLGQVKQTGLAVMESGQVVTMQQLDLVA